MPFKLFKCNHCDVLLSDLHNKRQHHYAKHMEIPFEDKYKIVHDCIPMKKVTCKICGWRTEAIRFMAYAKKHCRQMHREASLLQAFDFSQAIGTIGILCKKCDSFVERKRLDLYPCCPHGFELPEPSTSLTTETKPADATEAISTSSVTAIKQEVKGVGDPDQVEHEIKTISKVVCFICGYSVEHEKYMNRARSHWQKAHPGYSFDRAFDFSKLTKCIAIRCGECMEFIEKTRFKQFPDCRHGSRFEVVKPPEIPAMKRRAESPDHKNKFAKLNDDNEPTSTTYALNESPQSAIVHVKCEICKDKIRMDQLNEHIEKEHSDNTIVLDSDDDDDNDRMSKDEEHSFGGGNRKSSETKTQSMQPAKTQEDKGDAEFYPIRISKSELEKFLLQNRIYPTDGKFYLKDS